MVMVIDSCPVGYSDKKKNRSEHIEKVHVLNNKFYMLTKITQLREQVSTE